MAPKHDQELHLDEQEEDEEEAEEAYSGELGSDESEEEETSEAAFLEGMNEAPAAEPKPEQKGTDVSKVIEEKSQSAAQRKVAPQQPVVEETTSAFKDKLRFGRVQLNTMQSQMIDLRAKVESMLNIDLWAVTDPVLPFKEVLYKDWLHQAITHFYDDELWSAADQAFRKHGEVVNKAKQLKLDFDRLDAIQLAVVEQLLNMFKQQDDQIKALEAYRLKKDAEVMQHDERIRQLEAALSQQKFAVETLRVEEKKVAAQTNVEMTITVLLGRTWSDFAEVTQQMWDDYKEKTFKQVDSMMKGNAKSLSLVVHNIIKHNPQLWEYTALIQTYKSHEKEIAERFTPLHFNSIIEFMAKAYIERTTLEPTPDKI